MSETITTAVPGSGVIDMEAHTPVEVIVPCPSCARPMSSVNDSWQCLACHPTPVNIPICKTQICKRPLTKLGPPWNCLICLHCNKHPQEVNKITAAAVAEKKRPLLDKKITPEEVQKIVGVAIAKALAAQKPAYPPTQAEIKTMTEPEAINAVAVDQSDLPIEQRKIVVEVESKPETYLQKAKRLGVATRIPTGGMRKKVEIETDIAAKETEQVREEIAAGQTPPGEDAEFARGLTAEDMME